MRSLMSNLTDNAIYGLLSTIALSALELMMPIQKFLTFTIMLLFCDMITGIILARKQKIKITSSGFRRTINKMIVYFICILMGEGMRVVFMPMVPVTHVVAFTISITELKSIYENAEEYTGVPFWKAIKDKLKME